MSDVQSLAHTKWNCKYHVVFAPKYRRQVFYGEKSVRSARYCAGFVNGKVWQFSKRNAARIMYICCWRYRPR